jgi:serine acetyltransferase
LIYRTRDTLPQDASLPIFGPITIGDNVVIGPNAVVNFDVPAGKKVFAARSVIL